MSLYSTIKKAAMGAILSGSIALGSGGLETKLHAQVFEPPVIEWEKNFGSDIGYFVQQTTDGGYIVAGSKYSSETNRDVYLLKTDTKGNLEWEKTFGSGEGRSVQQTTDGGYIVGGSKLIKTDSLGEKQWEKGFDGRSVQQTSDEGYIIAGWTSSSETNLDVYLLKTDSLGETQWEKAFGGSSNDEGWSVQQTSDDGYVVTGYTHSLGAGNREVYLIKTDTKGNLEWEKTFGGANDYSGRSVQQTSDEGYIIAGWTNVGNYDAYLLKTDSLGETQWEKAFGGSSNDEGWSVQQTSDDGYVVTGYTHSLGAGNREVYLIKTDSFGEKEWEKTFGGAGYDEGRSVQQTTDHGYIITGSINGDIGLIKLAPTSPIKHASQNSFPRRKSSATNLAFVTHGGNSNADGWVSDMALTIFDNLAQNNKDLDWDVWTYDWRDAANIIPRESAIIAIEQGDLVSKALSTAGYDHLHLIAHSAGSWLIDTVSRKLENRDSKTIHLTFLDAYAAFDSRLGENADWAEHYFNKGDWPFTEEELTLAHNIDITGLTANGGSHSWPHNWYLESIKSSETFYFKDWGFAKSKEYLNSLPSHNDFPRGETTTLDEILLKPNKVFNGDFSSGNMENWIAQGNVAVIEFPPNSGNLAIQLTTASPASLSQNITTPNSPFLVTFDHAFKSSTGNTTINLGETTIGKLSSETSIDLGLSKNSYIITDSTLRNLETTLNFNFNGDAGSQAILDNISLNAVESPPEFIRGDANADSSFDISDPVYTLLHLFSNIPQPSCKKALDINDSGSIEITDAIYSLNTLFKAGPSPPSPYPSCNIDRTQDNDNLSCDSYPCQ